MMAPKTILFLGTHGQYNIGDELLLETFLSELGAQHRYYINSYDPTFTARQLAGRYEVQVFHTTQDRWQLVSLIRQCDLLFFGGGSILKELYKNVGRNRYATLIMVLGIVTFARLVARKPIVMSNIGVGPITTRFGLLLARLILRQVSYVSVRDQKSHDTCAGLGIAEHKLSFVPDAVFVKDAAFFLSEPGVKNKRSGKLRIGLNLNYNIEKPEHWDHFVEQLAQGLRVIHQRRPIEIHALPMQSHYKPHNDLEMLTALCNEIPEIDVVLHEPSTPQHAAKIIAACDILVAERLHALIMAAILHKPVVALVYDVKVRELAKYLGVEDFAIEIDGSFCHAALANCVLTLDERQDVSSQLQARVSELREQLRSYFEMLNHQIACRTKKA